MTSNKPTDWQKASGDGDSPFTGGRAENASEIKFSAPLRVLPVIGPYRAWSNLRLSRRF